MSAKSMQMMPRWMSNLLIVATVCRMAYPVREPLFFGWARNSF